MIFHGPLKVVFSCVHRHLGGANLWHAALWQILRVSIISQVIEPPFHIRKIEQGMEILCGTCPTTWESFIIALCIATCCQERLVHGNIAAILRLLGKCFT